MKQTKKLISVIMTLCLLFSFVSVVSAAGEQFTTTTAAGEYVRQQMQQRESTITFTYSMPREATQQSSYFSDTMSAIHDEAFRHTGNPVQGDYLHSVFGGDHSGASVRISSTTATLEITMNVDYKTTNAQEAELSAKVSEVIGQIIKKGMSDYEKIDAIHDYICDNVTYDYANLNDESYMLKYTAYAAMINGTAVCEGYATLFYNMCLAAGVDCRVLSGEAFNGEETGPHAWNLVKLGSKYYLLDSTWDDGTRSDAYFLRGSTQFNIDHFNDDESVAIAAQYPVSETDYVPCIHSVTKTENQKEATCTEEGYTGDVICTECSKLMSAGKPIEKVDHTAGESVRDNVIEANCTDNGSYDEVIFCTICSTEISRTAKIIPAKGHKDEDNNKVCDVCGEKIATPVIKGDANGDGVVNTADRMILARYVADPRNNENQIADKTALDFNGDGFVNTADRMILSRYLAKWSGYSVYFA